MTAMRVGFAIVVAASATLPAMAGPRPGHAVRVERVHRVFGTPRLCVAHDPSEMLCLGPRPDIGDAIEIVDTTRHLGTAQVAHVESKCTADEPNIWRVAVVTDGNDRASADGAEFGVIGVPLDPSHAHMIELDDASLADGMSMAKMFGVDTQGSGHSAVAFVFGACDTTNNPTFCFDVWTDRDDRGLERTQHAVLTRDCL